MSIEFHVFILVRTPTFTNCEKYEIILTLKLDHLD